MTDRAFYTADVDLFLPGGTISTYDLALGAAPIGALALNPEPLETTGVLRVSDDGYRTRASDPDGVVVYPPLLAGGISIDRALNLSPQASAAAWSFGALEIYDDGQISALMRAWNVDAQTIRIRRGKKQREDFQGYRSNRQTKGWYFDVAQVLQEAAAGVARWDYSTGSPVLLNEAEATNGVPNPRAEGAVAGSAGTAPTGWTVTSTTSSVTRTIVGTGTDGGIPYIDIRYAGTPSAGFNIGVQFMATNVCAAALGQTWTASAYVKLQAGSLTNVTSVSLRIAEAGGSSTPLTSQTITPTGAALYAQRFQVSRTISISDTTHVWHRFLCSVTSGAAVDFTLRFGVPQIEQAAAASSPILPAVSTPGATLRDADKLYQARNTWIAPAVADLDTVFTGMAGAWQAGENQVTIPIRDATYWLERPVQTTVYNGTGGYDGTANLAGVSVPMTRGTGYGIQPVLLDPTNRIYQYTDGKGTIIALYERGATGIALDSDTANLYAGSTAAGKYRTDNSRGIFQLGSTPVGQITVDATGEFPTAGNKTVAADIARYLLSETLSVPSDFIDTTSFATAATDYAYGAGIHIPAGAGTAGVDAVSFVLKAFGAQLYAGRDGKLRVLALRAIADDEAVAVVLGPHNIRHVTTVRLPDDIATPPWRIRVAAKWNYTIQQDVSSSATAAHRQEVAAQAQYVSWSDGAVLSAYRRPNDLPPFGGALTSLTDAQAVADDMGALLGVRRSLFAVEVSIETGLSIEFGQVAYVTSPLDVLTAGAKGRVVRELFRSADGITLGILV